MIASICNLVTECGEVTFNDRTRSGGILKSKDRDVGVLIEAGKGAASGHSSTDSLVHECELK